MRPERYGIPGLIKAEMQVQHIGFHLEGFHEIASLSTEWEAIMGTKANRTLKLETEFPAF